jgi:uncharacterized membrane protein YjjP (DUF1212 family)
MLYQLGKGDVNVMSMMDFVPGISRLCSTVKDMSMMDFVPGISRLCSTNWVKEM